MRYPRHLYGMTPGLMKHMEGISFSAGMMMTDGGLQQISRTYTFPEGTIEYSFNGTIETFIGTPVVAAAETPSKAYYAYFVITAGLLYKVDYTTSEDWEVLTTRAVVAFRIKDDEVTCEGITLYNYGDYNIWYESIPDDNKISSSDMLAATYDRDLGNSEYQGRITEMRLINESSEYWDHGIVTPCEIHLTYHPDLYPDGVLTRDSAYNVIEPGAIYTCYDKVAVTPPTFYSYCPAHPPPGDVRYHLAQSHVGSFGWEMPMCALGTFNRSVTYNNYPQSYLFSVLLPDADPYVVFRVHRKADILVDHVYIDCYYNLHSQWLTNTRTGTYVDKIYSPFGLLKEYTTTFQGQELFQGYLYNWTEGIQGIHGWQIVYEPVAPGTVWTAYSEKYDEFRLERVMNASTTHTITSDEAFYYNRHWVSHDYEAKYTEKHMASVFMWQFCPINQTANGIASDPETYVTFSRSTREIYLHAQFARRDPDWITKGRTVVVEDNLKDAIAQLHSALGVSDELREMEFDIIFTNRRI